MPNRTQKLLACGVLAGPLFVVAVTIQAVTRHGFDLTKQAASMLTLGGAGWIQAAVFIVTGALALACATGVAQALGDGPGGKWGPRLLYVYGGGLIAGGIFHPDPGSGFPPGTPSGESVVRSWHGVLHMVSGSIAFLMLIAVCFVLARHYASSGQRGWATCSRIVGTVFAVCLAASGAPHGSLTLFVGASIAMIWIAIVAAQLWRTAVSRARTRLSTPRNAHAVEQAA